MADEKVWSENRSRTGFRKKQGITATGKTLVMASAVADSP
jgi:hypothetical protein